MININKIQLSEKEQNILTILNVIMQKQEALSSDISKLTGLSTSTISRVLGTLKQKNMVVNTGKEITEKGRRPEYVRFNNEYGKLVHLDVMSDGIFGCLANLEGEVAQTERISFESCELTLNLLLDSIQSIYASLVRKNLSKTDRVLAVGMSVPGIADIDKRLVYRIPDVFPFNDIDVFSYTERMLNVPVIINNMSWLAAVGEQKYSNPPCENLVYLNFMPAIGIGAGVIINGKLVKGRNYLAGEIGDMFFDRNNFSKDSDTCIGHLEDYAGLKTMYQRVMAKVQDGKAVVLNKIMMDEKIKSVDLSLIERAVEAGDQDVEEIYMDTLQVWVILIISITLLINPDRLVLGGAISPMNMRTIDTINAILEKTLFCRQQVSVSELGENAVVSGGLHLLRQYVLNNFIAKEAITI